MTQVSKIASDSKTVMNSFCADDLASEHKTLNIAEDLPLQHSLGLVWYINSNIFTFCIQTNGKPVTQVGVLSMLNSLFDPSGMISRVVLKERTLMRDLISKQQIGTCLYQKTT